MIAVATASQPGQQNSFQPSPTCARRPPGTSAGNPQWKQTVDSNAPRTGAAGSTTDRTLSF